MLNTQLRPWKRRELDEALETSLLATSDPMQRLMVLQMKQMSLLSRQIQSRQPADPIQAVLGSGSSDSNGGSTSGIKGCLAREAFVKISEDLLKLAEVAQANALNELGRTSTQNTPGLMRDYLEQRVPLGNFKQLTQFGYLAAAAWEIGNRTSNKELQGFAAKMLMFIEQCAMDNGKSNLGWLMTGFARSEFCFGASAPTSERHETLHEVGSCELGGCQRIIPAGFGLSRNQDPQH